MATKKKMLQAAAGQAGGAGLDITEVFSTYLYEGTGATQTITNGIDLDGEGGLVWIKNRDFEFDNTLVFKDGSDTLKYLNSASTSSAVGTLGWFSSFNSDGFSITSGESKVNYSASGYNDYASWTFRKAPKFFDVVTYTGDGTSNRQIPHSIDGPVGFILIKRTDSTSNWLAWHRSVDPGYGILDLNLEFTSGSNGFFNAVADTYFETSWLNTSGATYVAYLFAHNDGDGEFGPDGDQDIIKCGSFNVNSGGWSVDLGFEPQWVMIKKSSGTSNWGIVDNMRSWDTLSGTGDNASQLRANLSNAENRETYPRITATGFNHEGAAGWLTHGETYIYMAIRRGPLAQPESGTEVFDAEQGSSGAPDNTLVTTTGFPVDMFMHFDNYTSGGENFVVDRLRGSRAQVRTQYTNAEAFYSTNNPSLDSNTGLINRSGSYQNKSNGFYWHFKRAPGFFDAVAYTGNSTAGRTVSHNLGVAPEMMWVKQRPYSSTWRVYHSALGNVKALTLNDTSAAYNLTSAWNSTTPTATEFTLGSSNDVNENSLGHIAYLFASLPGISKVGSYTSNGSQLNIDCGFSSGARFVLIKRTSGTGGWFVWDSERGITASNDPYLQLQSTSAEGTDNDVDIEPYSSGFTVNYGNVGINNLTGETYIFYAIA